MSEYFADIELARRLDGAEGFSGAMFVEARARAFPASGSTWTEMAGGVFVLFDGPDSPVTQVFGLGLFGEISEAELARVEEFYFSRSADVNLDVCPLSGVAFASMLSGWGYRPIELSSVMYRPISSGVPLKTNPEILIRTLDADEGRLFADVSAQGWGHLPELTKFWDEMIPVCTQREHSFTFVAEMAGNPIAVAVLCMHKGVALLAGACTVPEARRHGAQLALLDARLRHAAAQGCDLAMMCAEPGSTSQRNAERQGFRIAYTRTKWQLSRPRN